MYWLCLLPTLLEFLPTDVDILSLSWFVWDVFFFKILNLNFYNKHYGSYLHRFIKSIRHGGSNSSNFISSYIVDNESNAQKHLILWKHRFYETVHHDYLFKYKHIFVDFVDCASRGLPVPPL